jgi:Na+-driven multidrug efflux pump
MSIEQPGERCFMTAIERASTGPALTRKAAAGPASARSYEPRTRLLFEVPIARTLKPAAPNVLVMAAQASVGLIETYFVGKLGTNALAGVALVFPVVMLM